MASRETRLPRLSQAVDRGHLTTTVVKLYGYKVVQQSLVEKALNPELQVTLSIDGELYHFCSPVFKIEDEAHVWKLRYEEYKTKASAEGESSSVSLGDIRMQTRKVDVTGDPDGSQLRQLCQKGIMEDIQGVLGRLKACNLLLNLCDVPYPRPEDLCDKAFLNSLSKLSSINKVLVVHPKPEAEACGAESGLEGAWSRYLATDMVCQLWRREESHFTMFEKKILKHVVQNGLHEVKVKEQQALEKNAGEESSTKVEETALQKEEKADGKGEIKTPKNDEKHPKNEEKTVIKSDRSLKKEEKTIKKEPKTVKSEAKPVVVRREQKPLRTEQRSQKRNSKIFKTEQISPKNEPSPKPLRREQKSAKGEVKPPKTEPKPTRTGTKTAKKDQKCGTGVDKTIEREQKKPLELQNGQLPTTKSLVELARNAKLISPLLVEISSHPAVRGFCLTVVLLAFYFLSSEIFISLMLIAASLWFKYGSKKPEFKKYTRSGDPQVLAFRRVYEKEIEKLRYARDLGRMRDVHKELKESVLNAYAVNKVSKGDIMGVEHHAELERELELTFKEFVTENDVETLLHEAHYTSFVLALTVFLYLTSRVVYLGLGKVWRPVRTVAVIVSAILLCFALSVVSNFLSLSFISTRLVGSAEMFCVVFGLWLVTDVTGVLIELRACIDHVAGVIWREVDLEKCILKSPSYLSVKLALDCAVILSLFPLVYASSGVLSVFSVSSVTIVSVSRYFPPGVILLRVFTRLAFFGEVLRLANVIMFVSLTSKFYGLHNKREDSLDSFVYNHIGYDVGTVTEYIWKAMVRHINDLN